MVIAFRHRVQILMERVLPFSVILVLTKFGDQVRLVRRFEWLTLCPVLLVLLQIAQALAIGSKIA